VPCDGCIKISNYSTPSHQVTIWGVATVECMHIEMSTYDFGSVTLDNCFLSKSNIVILNFLHQLSRM